MKSNDKISVPANFKNAWNEKRARRGKTARDQKSGATQRRLQNLAMRGEWSREKGTAITFPKNVLMGNGNSSNRRPERSPKAA